MRFLPRHKKSEFTHQLRGGCGKALGNTVSEGEESSLMDVLSLEYGRKKEENERRKRGGEENTYIPTHTHSEVMEKHMYTYTYRGDRERNTYIHRYTHIQR